MSIVVSAADIQSISRHQYPDHKRSSSDGKREYTEPSIPPLPSTAFTFAVPSSSHSNRRQNQTVSSTSSSSSQTATSLTRKRRRDPGTESKSESKTERKHSTASSSTTSSSSSSQAPGPVTSTYTRTPTRPVRQPRTHIHTLEPIPSHDPVESDDDEDNDGLAAAAVDADDDDNDDERHYRAIAIPGQTVPTIDSLPTEELREQERQARTKPGWCFGCRYTRDANTYQNEQIWSVHYNSLWNFVELNRHQMDHQVLCLEIQERYERYLRNCIPRPDDRRYWSLLQIHLHLTKHDTSLNGTLHQQIAIAQNLQGVFLNQGVYFKNIKTKKTKAEMRAAQLVISIGEKIVKMREKQMAIRQEAND